MPHPAFDAWEVARDAPSSKPLVKLRPASPPRNVANCDRDGLLLADQDHEPLAAGNAGVEEISLQHCVVLGRA